MLGFSAAPDEAVDDELRVANGYLRAYDAWTAKLDAFLQLDVDGLETIVDWRVDAERARRERGEAGLSDDDARDYIERFLPAYRVYVPRLRERPPRPTPCASCSVPTGCPRRGLFWARGGLRFAQDEPRRGPRR